MGTPIGHYLTSNTHKSKTATKHGSGAGGFEECKDFHSLRSSSVPETNAASLRVPIGSLIFNTPTPPFAEDLRSTEEAINSADTVKRARFAQRTEEQRLHKAHQRRTEGGLFLQHLDFTSAAAAEE